MNGEDAATYVHESMLADARFEVDYAMERDRYARSKGYGGSSHNDDDIIDTLRDITDCMGSIIDEINDLKSRVDELENELEDQKQLWSSPFVLVREDQEVNIKAKKVKQIQLTDSQFDRLMDKFS